MQIMLDRGGELWWMARRPDGPRLVLRYGIQQPGWSYLATFGFVVKLPDGDCVPCTDDGEVLLYKAKWGPLYNNVTYTHTEAEARELVLHMARGYSGYLRRSLDGPRLCYNMLPFETHRYAWERAQC